MIAGRTIASSSETIFHYANKLIDLSNDKAGVLMDSER